MLAKLGLLLLLDSTSLIFIEEQKEDLYAILPTEILCKIADIFILENSDTPTQLIETLSEALNNIRLSSSLFDLRKERIIKLIQEITKNKGVNFIEEAVFKALFKKRMNLVSWLYYGLQPEVKGSLSAILCPLIYHKFAPEILYKGAASLISGSCMPISIISTSKTAEDLKALTYASFFVLQYTDFDDEERKKRLIRNYIIVLQGLAYAYEKPLAKDDFMKISILIKFLAKLCALEYIELKDIDQLWESFFDQAREHICDYTKIDPAYVANRSKFLTDCSKKKKKMKSLLNDKCEFYKKHLDKSDLVIYNTHPKIAVSASDITEEDLSYKTNDCILF